mmetsp:Transcript_68135/g.192523  ORF Transcript_68135/g.192523 Transcript_68135/m.192523 type:complete len:316 (+) Transcript_68135:168-1115(+)
MDLTGCGGQLLRCTDTSDDVLTLGVQQVFAVELVLPSRRIPREGHPCSAILAHVPEDHGLNVHCGAPTRRNVVQAPIRLRALVHPRSENGANSAPELFLRIFREQDVQLVDHLRFVCCHELFEVGLEQVAIRLHTAPPLRTVQQLLEVGQVDAEHHVGIHLDEASVAVEGEAPVARPLRQALHCAIIQSQVQDSIHHARHGGACPGANRHQQWVIRVSELLARPGLHQCQCRAHLAQELRGVALALLVPVRAHLGGEGEARRHRQPNTSHLREVRSLAAQQIFHVRASICLALAEIVNPLRRHGGDKNRSFAVQI